jgi:hypothetical protein
MDAQTRFIVFALLALSVSVALNFLLTLRLAAIVGAREYERQPMALPVGSVLPQFSARRLRDGRMIASNTLQGAAAVLVFLSPQCGDCRIRRGEIAQMRAAMRNAGVTLWVFGAGTRRSVTAFLADTPLLDDVMEIRTSVWRRLNPRNAAPFYLFVDDEGTILASHFIGDADWQSFCGQMQAEMRAMSETPGGLVPLAAGEESETTPLERPDSA